MVGAPALGSRRLEGARIRARHPPYSDLERSRSFATVSSACARVTARTCDPGSQSSPDSSITSVATGSVPSCWTSPALSTNSFADFVRQPLDIAPLAWNQSTLVNAPSLYDNVGVKLGLEDGFVATGIVTLINDYIGPNDYTQPYQSAPQLTPMSDPYIPSKGAPEGFTTFAEEAEWQHSVSYADILGCSSLVGGDNENVPPHERTTDRVLRVAPALDPSQHLISDRDVLDARTDLVNDPRYFDAGDARKTRREHAATDLPVDRVHGGRLDPNANRAGVRVGIGNIGEVKDLRSAELREADCFHGSHRPFWLLIRTQHILANPRATASPRTARC